MSAFTCILPPDNSAGAPQLCLWGTHMRNVWWAKMSDLYPQVPLQGVFKNSHPPLQKPPFGFITRCHPLTQPLEICLRQTLLNRGARSLRADQSVWERERCRWLQLCHSACQLLHIFPFLTSGLTCDYRLYEEARTCSVGCLLMLAYVISAQLWLN